MKSSPEYGCWASALLVLAYSGRLILPPCRPRLRSAPGAVVITKCSMRSAVQGNGRPTEGTPKSQGTQNTT